MPTIKVKSEEIKIKVPITIERIEPSVQEKTIKPSIKEQIVLPDEGIHALSKVTVNAVTKDIDENILAENIREGVDILDTIGTLKPFREPILQNKTVNPTEETQTIVADEGFDGLGEVIINAQTGGDASEYFETTITEDNRSGFFAGVLMKKFPTFKVETTDLSHAFTYYRGTVYPELDTTGVTNMSYMFNANSNAEELPYLNTSSVTDMSYMFANCGNLKSLKQYDTSKVENMLYCLQNCKEITTFPQWDYSSVTNMSYMCTQTGIKTMPNLTISSVTNCRYMFQTCTPLTTVGDLNFGSVTNCSYMFQGCSSLTTVGDLNFGLSTDCGGMFYMCSKLTTVGDLNFGSNTNATGLFNGCTSLVSVGNIDMSSVDNVTAVFANCKLLETIKGIKDLGKGYLTTRPQGYASHTVTLSSSTKLTEQSIINVLNGLYDIASKGCKPQKCVLGSTNLAKLTSEEGQQALSNAQTKGWTIS